MEEVQKPNLSLQTFLHKNLDDLDRILSQAYGSTKPALVAVKNVYSMDSGLVQLQDIINVAMKHGACVNFYERHCPGIF
jgi:7-keto-8-aminopelargonate synthetase-like enzyme